MLLSNHLDKLKAFKLIVESGTMRDAAKKLHVTQPSLTKLVHSLESASGVKLLSRGRMGVAPTEAGRQLLAYSARVLKDLEDLEQRLLNPSDRLAGHLRIGAWASLAEYLWPEFIPHLRKLAPALRISIHASESLAHRRSLETEELDILVDAEPKTADGLIAWKLYEDRFGFYTGKNGLGPEAKIESLPLIYSPSASDRDSKRITQHLEENGYFFQERLEFDSFMAVLSFARKGWGLAVLPNRLAREAVRSGQLRPMPLQGFPSKGFGLHHFTATIRESRKDDPRLRFLIRALRDWFSRSR